jgi:BirA family biotin operon repressor/biotin-[acetyl-CoA-carboxylase] ligase
MFDLDALRAALTGLRFGRRLVFFQQIDSTNDHAKRLADEGAPEGTLVMAEEQTAGRGRAGRKWLTPPGAALALSVILRPALTAAHAPRLTMLAGLAGCEAIEQAAGVPAALKWPNDLLVAGKKAGGVLVEGALEGGQLKYAVLGIGINVSAAPPPAEVDFPATCLAAECGRAVDRLLLLRALLERLEQHAAAPEGAALFAAWRARLLWLGGPVVVRAPEGELRGRAEDVDPDGALLLRLADGALQRVLAGDVRLRPAGD